MCLKYLLFLHTFNEATRIFIHRTIRNVVAIISTFGISETGFMSVRAILMIIKLIRCYIHVLYIYALFVESALVSLCVRAKCIEMVVRWCATNNE